jgi:hypothetical protein
MILKDRKMKHFSFIVVTVVLSLVSCKNCPAQRNRNLANDSIIKKAQQLKELCIKSSGPNGGNEYFQQIFFDNFPNTYNELIQLYGYNNDTPAILYNYVEQHIVNMFNELHSVNDTLYFNKLTSISINGHWDADAVNAFQEGLRQRVLDNPELVIYVLRKNHIHNIESFWHFYFDGPHPKKNIDERLSVIKEKDPEMYSVILKAHNDIVVDWDKNGE